MPFGTSIVGRQLPLRQLSRVDICPGDFCQGIVCVNSRPLIAKITLYNVKNGDNLKNEDNLKTEDNLKNEDNL